MGKVTVHCFVAKRTAGGTRYYWQPSATLKAQGWKALSLGLDEGAAITAAKARNAEVAAWRKGGGSPREVAPIVQRHTVDAVIAAYKRAKFKPKAQGGLSDNTQDTYGSLINTISKWAGRERMDAITRKNVLVFRDALYAPRKDGRIHTNTAYNTLKMLRTLFDWAQLNEYVPKGHNPAAGDLDAPAPAARQQFASSTARCSLVNVAIAMGRPNMAAAIMLAWTIGQREEDLLKLLQSRYDEIQPYEVDDPAVYERRAAAEPDGRVFGIRMRQGKTDRWVGVPVIGDARQQLEAAIAAARAANLATILFDEARSRSWTASDRTDRMTRQAHFQRLFAEIRQRAAHAATVAGDEELAAELADLQFRDLRRTCVVMMGQRGLPDHLIAAITGHKLETVKKILEVYLPRTTGMAMLAVDLMDTREALHSRAAADKGQRA